MALSDSDLKKLKQMFVESESRLKDHLESRLSKSESNLIKNFDNKLAETALNLTKNFDNKLAETESNLTRNFDNKLLDLKDDIDNKFTAQTLAFGKALAETENRLKERIDMNRSIIMGVKAEVDGIYEVIRDLMVQFEEKIDAMQKSVN